MMCYFLLVCITELHFLGLLIIQESLKMKSTAVNTSSDNATGSSRIVPSTADSIALCTTSILSFLFIVVGNLLNIVLFAVNKRLRKRSLFLDIMALADLIFGTCVASYLHLTLLGQVSSFGKVVGRCVCGQFSTQSLIYFYRRRS